MAADMGCAHLQSLSNLSPGLPVGINSNFAPNATLIFDPVGQARSGRVSVPAHAPERLVEMGMRVNQTRIQQCAFAIDLLRFVVGSRPADRDDITIADQHI